MRRGFPSMNRITRSIAFCLIASTVACAQASLFGILNNPVPQEIVPVVAIGDLDGDGDADLVGEHGLAVNDGHGRFSQVPNALPFSRRRVIVADLNNDALPDVVSVDNGIVPNALRVDVNLGGLAFLQASGLPVLSEFIVNVAVGDADSDGDPDLLVGTIAPIPPWFGLASAYLWLNDGSGGFTTAPSAMFPPSLLPNDRLLLEDLDGDGDVDAFVGTTIAINANGVFSFLPTPIWNSSYIPGIDVGNFNGDGLPDIAFSGYNLGPFVAIMLGSPGGFLPPVTTLTADGPSRLTAIDLDGDGLDELVRTYVTWTGGTSVHDVSTTGVVGPATQTWPDIVGLPGEGVEVARDLDGDGDQDLIANGGSDAVTLMNDGNGVLVRIDGQMSTLTSKDFHVAGDLDADGDADVAGLDAAASITTGLNDGDGTFLPGPPTPLTGNQYSYSFHLWDRDGDGDDDLYAALAQPWASTGDLLHDNAGGGAFAPVATITGTGWTKAFAAADFDGDGDQDVVLGRRVAYPPGTGAAGPMLLLANLGAGVLSAPVPVGGSHGTFDVDVADFDGNGLVDVFQTNANPLAGTTGGPDDCVVYLNFGGGGYAAVVQPGLSGTFTAAGDLNNDGMADLVIDGQVWTSTGGGLFAPGPALASPLAGPPTLADLDEDGNLDLVESPGTVMRNGGGGVFGLPVSHLPRSTVPATSLFVPASVVADVDRDGDPDILAPGPRVLNNLRRQIARGSVARPGRPASLELFGTPGGAWLLFASNGTASIVQPPFGTVLIDPATAVLFASGFHAPPGSPTAGKSVVGATLPNIPTIIGWTTHWQSLDGATLKLSNRITLTVLAF